MATTTPKARAPSAAAGFSHAADSTEGRLKGSRFNQTSCPHAAVDHSQHQFVLRVLREAEHWPTHHILCEIKFEGLAKTLHNCGCFLQPVLLAPLPFMLFQSSYLSADLIKKAERFPKSHLDVFLDPWVH